jgi:enoyl-CoA hydratase/carnithine racemase
VELVSKPIKYQVNSGVAWITLVAPQLGNTINCKSVLDLNQFLQQATTDESCRVIIISAEGSDFCKGFDLETSLIDGHDTSELCTMFLDCLSLIYSSSRPVIASVEGNVTAGGVGLVAACDLVLANENIAFMLSEVIVGMIPALIAPFLLRRLSPARVKYMALSTRSITTSEAKEIGLVDEVVAVGEMTQQLNRQLKRLFRASPQAIAESKRYLDKLDSKEFPLQKKFAIHQLMSWLEHPEVVAGIQTFAQGFTPPWFQKYKG